jgi:hypothetical protein
MRLSTQEHSEIKNNQSILAVDWCLMNKKGECKVHSLTYEDLMLDVEKSKCLKSGIYYIYKMNQYYSKQEFENTGKYITVL